MLSLPAGVFVGRDSIRQHLYMNVGGGKVGDIGMAMAASTTT